MTDYKKEYSAQIKSPLWQKKRLEIMERDGWQCQSCGGTGKELQVHHLSYVKDADIWDYDNSKLTTICIDCHNEITKIKKDIYSLINENSFFMDRIRVFYEIIETLSHFNFAELSDISDVIKTNADGRMD
jgi:hypothetical protein